MWHACILVLMWHACFLLLTQHKGASHVPNDRIELPSKHVSSSSYDMHVSSSSHNTGEQVTSRSAALSYLASMVSSKTSLPLLVGLFCLYTRSLLTLADSSGVVSVEEQWTSTQGHQPDPGMLLMCC
jgi:hypothetical protein